MYIFLVSVNMDDIYSFILGADPRNESANGERTMKVYSGVTIVLMVGLLLLSVAVVKLFLSRPGRWSVSKGHRHTDRSSEFSFPDSSVLTDHV